MESDTRALAMREPKLAFGAELVKLIADIDEFKGKWEALRTISPDRLRALRKVATIESVGSSTRIEGAKLSDAEVEDLLSRAISIKSLKTHEAGSGRICRGDGPRFRSLCRHAPHREPYPPTSPDLV